MIRISFMDYSHTLEIGFPITSTFDKDSREEFAQYWLDLQCEQWVENQMFDMGIDPDSRGKRAKEIRNWLIEEFYQNNVTYEIL